VRKQLERATLQRGSWATVMFLYADLDQEAAAFGPPRIAVVRFQKWRGGWRKHSAFTLTSAARAREFSGVLERWMPLMAADAADEPAEPSEADMGAEA
jgi:hypothetical protein